MAIDKILNTYHFNSLDDAYKQLIADVLNCGDVVESRIGATTELLWKSFILTDPRNRIIRNTERKLSLKFAFGEFIWIMSGSDKVDDIAFYNKRMRDFSDDGETLHGAYGKRLRNWNGKDQIQLVIDKLRQFPSTRQAVLSIYDPELDAGIETKDFPCNSFLQLFIRNNALYMSVFVRSQDLYLGLPYDIFHWTMLQELIANELVIDLGTYYHIMGSLHIYDSNKARLQRVSRYPVDSRPMQKFSLKFSEINRLIDIDRSVRNCTILLTKKANLSNFESLVLRALQNENIMAEI